MGVPACALQLVEAAVGFSQCGGTIREAPDQEHAVVPGELQLDARHGVYEDGVDVVVALPCTPQAMTRCCGTGKGLTAYLWHMRWWSCLQGICRPIEGPSNLNP